MAAVLLWLGARFGGLGELAAADRAGRLVLMVAGGVAAYACTLLASGTRPAHLSRP